MYSNPEGAESGQVSVVSPALDDQGSLAGFRFGLVDESSKLNLNILPQIDTLMLDGGRTLLMALPAMEEEVADAIMDWIDSDTEAVSYTHLTLPTRYRV